MVTYKRLCLSDARLAETKGKGGVWGVGRVASQTSVHATGAAETVQGRSGASTPRAPWTSSRRQGSEEKPGGMGRGLSRPQSGLGPRRAARPVPGTSGGQP